MEARLSGVRGVTVVVRAHPESRTQGLGFRGLGV